jgi:hypothetical protein
MFNLGNVNRIYAAAGGGIQPPWGVTISSPAEIVNRVMPIIYGVLGIALFAYFVYGGYMWVMSSGDPEKIKKATNTMFHAAIGTGIVVFAYLATRIVGGVFGITLF